MCSTTKPKSNRYNNNNNNQYNEYPNRKVKSSMDNPSPMRSPEKCI